MNEHRWQKEKLNEKELGNDYSNYVRCVEVCFLLLFIQAFSGGHLHMCTAFFDRIFYRIICWHTIKCTHSLSAFTCLLILRLTTHTKNQFPIFSGCKCITIIALLFYIIHAIWNQSTHLYRAQAHCETGGGVYMIRQFEYFWFRQLDTKQKPHIAFLPHYRQSKCCKYIRIERRRRMINEIKWTKNYTGFILISLSAHSFCECSLRSEGKWIE